MSKFHLNILTLFPDMFPGMLGQSLAGRALERGDWSFNAINIRDFTTDKHNNVDDTPYGGGAGMVMRADVIERALLSIEEGRNAPAHLRQNKGRSAPARLRPNKIGRKIYLSPRGKPLNQTLVKELSAEESLTLLCGRYEGVDQRVLDAYDFEEISIGDYVLSGGEPAALILMDACIRLLPGVMGNKDTADNESFGTNTGGLLEYPHYTRPAEWIDAGGTPHKVPDILQSGNHAKIEDWRKEQSETLTKAVRPDLLPLSQKGTKTPSFSKSEDVEEIGRIVVDCGFRVHKELGPGLLESVYEEFLFQELCKKNLSVQKQVPISVKTENFQSRLGFRADLVIENQILIELKSVERILPVHKAQLISYLKLGQYPLGFLMNFNSALFKDGIRRFVS